MPRYVIERQYLVPIYEHILVEALDLEAACRAALDEHAHPWGNDTKTDYSDARPTTITQAVAVPDDVGSGIIAEGRSDYQDLDLLLYHSGLPLLPIPGEFTDDSRANEAIGFS
jgi:hypothetical protein